MNDCCEQIIKVSSEHFHENDFSSLSFNLPGMFRCTREVIAIPKRSHDSFLISELWEASVKINAHVPGDKTDENVTSPCPYGGSVFFYTFPFREHPHNGPSH